MSKNNIEELRQHLFYTMRKLKDGSIALETAKAISDVGQTIINTAKVEIDYAKAVNGDCESKFLAQEEDALPEGITSVKRHRIA